MIAMTRPELANLPRGWPHHIVKLLDLLDEYRPMRVVELGTWYGASAIAMARLTKTWGGHVFCVDTWRGKERGSGTLAGPAVMLDACRRNVVKAGVRPWVHFKPGLTTTVARTWDGGPIDFLYVDADHRYEGVLADLEAWWPHLRVGGLVAGDDVDNPMYPGVRMAWEAFGRAHGQTWDLYATPNTEPPGMQLIYGVKS